MIELCVRDNIIFVLIPDLGSEIGWFRNIYRCCMSGGNLKKNQREERVCKVKELNKLRAVTNR